MSALGAKGLQNKTPLWEGP